MDIAHQIAADGASHGTVVATGKQYAGRGQHTRKWDAKHGKALLCSIIIRPDTIITPAQQLQSISLRAACAVHRMLQERLDITARIRWPNDILIEEKKVCGILSEYRVAQRNADGELPPSTHIIVGIGINCRQRRFPHQYGTEPTSLYLSGYGRRGSDGGITPRALLAPLISALCYELTKPQGWHEYINTYLWRKGEVITIHPAILHKTPFTGRLLDVAEDGSLRYIRTSANTHTASFVEQLYAGSIR